MAKTRKYLVFLDVDGVFTSSRVHFAHNPAYGMWHERQVAATTLARRLSLTNFAELLIGRLFRLTERIRPCGRDTGSNPVTVLLLARNYTPAAGTGMVF